MAAQRKGIDYWRTPNYQDTKTKQTPSDNALRITPNPAQNSVLVVWELPYSNALLSLYDYTGKVVTQQSVNGRSLSMDLSALPIGVYVTRLTAGNGTVVATGKIALVK